MVMELSHHVVVLDHGRVICEGRPDYVQCQPDVIKAYLGESDHLEVARQTRIEQRVKAPAIGERQRTLEVRSLSTRYGSIEALRGVSLYVDEGECVAVLGANGAGETTLLRTIAGSLAASSGQVLLGDKDITRLSAPETVELGVCQVLEGRHVFPTLSVQDNLMLGAGKKYKGKPFEQAVAEVYDVFPVLAERRHQTAGSLSGGEQQMLAIGRTLMGRPRIMLLDEPSMGLAPLVVQTIFDVLVELNGRGLTLLMVEQNAKAALSIADRALVLVTGEVALEGTSDQLREDPRVSALYLGG
jgi:branched-chain amino acid transport system ATP-binding protein